MKVSILVAVYNAEKVLSRCLDSLVRQTYRDIEVLMVDDGSTDQSWLILSDYADRDARFHAISSPQNFGPAHARNMALSHVTGDIVTFVDSDDWVADDAIASIVEEFQQYPLTDVVLFDLLYCWPNGTQSPYHMPAFTVKDGQQAFIDSLSWHIHGIYAVRTEIHRRIPYDESCRWFSDDNTTRLHYLSAREVRMSKARYYYWQSEHSISHDISIRRMDYLRANESMKQQIMQLNFDRKEWALDVYEKVRWLVLVDTYMFYFVNREHFSTSEKSYCLKEMHRIWKNIEKNRLPMSLKCKFGYIPFSVCWMIFRCQEELYFVLKRISGRL